MNAIEKIRDLVPNPTCVYEALVPILASCETPSNTLERTRLGVQLSLCEFNAAHVSYPILCHDPSQLRHCTQILETKPTWWTTFSGNYQRISVICSEFQSEFQARQFVEIVQNVTDLLAVYEEQQKATVMNAESSIMNAMEKWNDSRNQLWTELGQFGELLTEMNLAIARNQSYLQHELAVMGSSLDITLTSTECLKESLQSMDLQMNSLTGALSLHKEGLDMISSGHIQAAEKLHRAIDQTLTVIDSTNDALQDCQSFLTTLRSFISYLVYLAIQFWVIMIMITILVYMARRWWIRKTIAKKLPADAIDPLFL